MPSHQLENLVKAGNLKYEPCDQTAFNGLLRSAEIRLADAHRHLLAIESRFDLAYNAAYALALAALRWYGYQCRKRDIVFQCIPHTLGLDSRVWRVLSLCHDLRSAAEISGETDIDEQLLTDLLTATDRLLETVRALGPVR